MNNNEKKIKRLVDIARLYYEQDKTQSDIAGIYGISRPMVSKLIREARERGIVTISIQPPSEGEAPALEQLKREFGIRGGVLVPHGESDTVINQGIAEAAIFYLQQLGGGRLGIGWGHIIGNVADYMERSDRPVVIGTHICPLIGNGGVGLKNYHSNELVRVIAEGSKASPQFLYSPACVLSEQELKLTRELDNYHEVYKAWEKLDVALVNIGNFPSVPDFASEARYGDILNKRKAVGRLLNYFVDGEGRIIHSDTDYAIQIPLELLSRTRNVVGICSANTSARALQGVLRTGFIHHVIAPEQVVKYVVSL